MWFILLLMHCALCGISLGYSMAWEACWQRTVMRLLFLVCLCCMVFCACKMKDEAKYGRLLPFGVVLGGNS